MSTDGFCSRENGIWQLSTTRDHPAVQSIGASNGGTVEAAWRYLRAGADSDAQLSEASAAERLRQQAALIDWAREHDRLIAESALHVHHVISNKTSEHEVRYRNEDAKVIKMTWPGFYGQVPVVRDGKLEREVATPAQYLWRTALYNAAFSGAIDLEGVCASERPSMVIGEKAGQPSLVITQPWYSALDKDNPNPTSEEVATFMQGQGFTHSVGSYFGWIRSEDGMVVVDAKPDNFILTARGVIPIDLQMVQVDPSILRLNGLVTDRREGGKSLIIFP